MIDHQSQMAYATKSISKGRAELVVGRGSFGEGFPRAGLLGLPLMVAIIGRTYERFRPLVDLAAKILHADVALGGLSRITFQIRPPDLHELQPPAPSSASTTGAHDD